MSVTYCGAMGVIIIEGVQSVDPWDPSSLRGYRVCGYSMDWILAISNGGGSMCAAIDEFMIK